jgi:hypothetical protein
MFRATLRLVERNPHIVRHSEHTDVAECPQQPGSLSKAQQDWLK